MSKQYNLQIKLSAADWQKKEAAQCNFCIGSDPFDTHFINNNQCFSVSKSLTNESDCGFSSWGFSSGG